MGCELPEHLRQYYLDVMGIDSWQLQQADATAIVEESVEHQSSQSLDAVNDTATGVDSWSELEHAVAACEECEALCQSRTQTIFGVGNRMADVMVIGEAPGADEDNLGEPFVGPAGQLLNAMLKAIQLQRQEVFTANVIKCRTPEDRDPLALETENCNAYLRQQISLIQPKVILAVGRVAAQALLVTDTAVGKLRGQSHQFDGIPVIVTYHPAYLLRKPSEKERRGKIFCR